MLLFVLAGPKEAVQRVIPFTKGVMGKAHIDLTDKSYGQASTLKIIGNSFVMSMVEGLAEGLALSEKTGLGTEAYAEFIEALFPGPAAAYAKRMTSGKSKSCILLDTVCTLLHRTLTDWLRSSSRASQVTITNEKSRSSPSTWHARTRGT